MNEKFEIGDYIKFKGNDIDGYRCLSTSKVYEIAHIYSEDWIYLIVPAFGQKTKPDVARIFRNDSMIGPFRLEHFRKDVTKLRKEKLEKLNHE